MTAVISQSLLPSVEPSVGRGLLACQLSYLTLELLIPHAGAEGFIQPTKGGVAHVESKCMIS